MNPPKNFKSDVYIVRARDKRRLQNDVLRKRLSEQNGINILIISPFDGEQSGSSLWTTRECYLSKTHSAQWRNWEQDGGVFSLFFFVCIGPTFPPVPQISHILHFLYIFFRYEGACVGVLMKYQ